MKMNRRVQRICRSCEPLVGRRGGYLRRRQLAGRLGQHQRPRLDLGGARGHDRGLGRDVEPHVRADGHLYDRPDRDQQLRSDRQHEPDDDLRAGAERHGNAALERAGRLPERRRLRVVGLRPDGRSGRGHLPSHRDRHEPVRGAGVHDGDTDRGLPAAATGRDRRRLSACPGATSWHGILR